MTVLTRFIILFLNILAATAADFRNFRFEEPILTHLVPWNPVQAAPAAELFSGWSVYRNGVPYFGDAVYVAPDDFGTGGFLTLWAGRGTIPTYVRSGPDFFEPNALWSLRQSGTVPDDARTVILGSEGLESIFANNVKLNRYKLETIYYGYDISSYTGREVELRIDFRAPTIFFNQGFSPEAIPEPSEVALLGAGLASLLWLRRRGR